MSTVTIRAMNTKEGNELVQRMVDAAARLVNEQGATLGEAAMFVLRSLDTLSCSSLFAEADSTVVRMEAFHAVEFLTREQVEA